MARKESGTLKRPDSKTEINLSSALMRRAFLLEEIMCRHEWLRINDVRVCKRCGVTLTPDNKVLFDRKLVNPKKKGKKKK